MSVIRWVQLQCDICTTQSATISGGSAEAKKQLRLEGWRFRGGVHRCPTCATAERQSPAEEASE